MSQFSYEARDSNGQLLRGTLAAGSVAEAGRLLAERGQYVIRVTPVEGEGEGAGLLDRLWRRRVPRREVMWLMAQLATMMDAQININEALQCLSRQNVSPRMKHVLQDMSRHVREGKPLSEAMQQHPGAFPVTVVSLVRASELSGTLTFTLQRISQYLFMEQRIRSQVRSALVYPAIMLAVCLGVTLALLLTLVPRFEAMFEARGAALPAPTRWLLGVNELLIHHWPVWLLAVALLSGGLWMWRRTEQGRAACDAALLRMPVIGPMLGKIEQQRSYQTVGTLIESGVPLLETLQMAQEGARNVHYRKLWAEVAESVKQGQRFAGPLLHSPLVEEPIAQMIESGDHAGRLGPAFGKLSEVLEEEFQASVRNATQALEPAMIILVGSIVGFVAIALLLPLLSAAQVMSG